MLKQINLLLGSCHLFNEWQTYLKILVVVSLLLVGVRLTLSDTMVIYAQKDKPDIMQVYFPKDGTYNEENSGSKLFDSSQKGVEIVLPASYDHVRVDPGQGAGEIVIAKIEVRRLFNTQIYMPNDLLAHAKPIMMIDKFEVIPAGLLIRSTGNDPAFELQLNKPTGSSKFFILGIVSVFISLVLFSVMRLYSSLKIPTLNSKVYLFAIPFLVSLGIAALFYPGFMSYDSLHSLRGARNGVTDSEWPPMVSYVWRAVDLISSNPSAMHFSQIYILLLSIYSIVFIFTRKIRYATLFLVVYLSIPVVLGTVAVIWKDVLMAAFLLAGFAVTLFVATSVHRWRFILLSLLALLLIFLGVCSRHNAITGAVPLLFYLAFVLSKRLIKRPLYIWLSFVLLGSVLTGSVFVTKTLLDNYSLPSFHKLDNSTSLFIHVVRVLDVAGASVCVGNNLFAEMAPNLSLSEISSKYDPKHINLSSGLLAIVGVDSRINKIWLNVAIHHPVCILYNKFELTKYMLGANKEGQFLVTDSSIVNNEYGYSLRESSLRNAVVGYIVKASDFFFYKPWFLYLISIIAFVYMLRIRALTAPCLTLYLSATFYLSSLIMFGNAADARLTFYTTTVLIMFTFISIIEFKKVKI
jgi:hypothetical protein